MAPIKSEPGNDRKTPTRTRTIADVMLSYEWVGMPAIGTAARYKTKAIVFRSSSLSNCSDIRLNGFTHQAHAKGAI